MSSNLCRTWIM